MKWKNKKEPKLGDSKVEKHFAWVPTLIGDDWVWLEFYYIHYQWTERVVEMGWEPVEESLKKGGREKKSDESWNWLK
jgi:hypothetical protein